MTKFSLIRPLDQPPGTRRLLQDLKNGLQDDRFTHFWLIVAYARSGPFYRLRELLEAWRFAGKTSAAMFGIDQRGTSKDALELALTLFDCVYVTREVGITFHPKIYFFKGENHAQAFVGSNNFTVGGTEKNFESAVHLELELPRDADELALLESAWTALLPASCVATKELDAEVLADLVANRFVVDEKTMFTSAGAGDAARVGRKSQSGLVVMPETPLPKRVISRSRRARSKIVIARPVSVAVSSKQTATTRGFAIQVKPHHNGEIFLSLTAVQQNPDFFCWPFNGETSPRKPGNPSYPQLTPDPVVNIMVFGTEKHPILTLSKYNLNTVYYEKKHEIRITASPLVDTVPEYSVMIMEPSFDPDVTYEITIHRTDSPDYDAWKTACNQSMPGGGREPRKFGWF